MRGRRTNLVVFNVLAGDPTFANGALMERPQHVSA
jgi:hypothetical protein